MQSLSHLIMSRTINRHNTGIAQHLLRQPPVIRPSAAFLFKYFRGVLLEIIANMMYSTLQSKRY